MTDDHNKAVEKQPQNATIQSNQVQTNSTQTTKLQSQSTVSNHSTQSSTAKSTNIAQSTAEPQIKKVDIAIAGVTYPIYCPVHEQEELLSAVSYINDFALNLRRNAPNLSQENLLVLCCLNLYEKIHSNKRSEEDRLQQSKQSESLLNKIMKDAHSIL